MSSLTQSDSIAALAAALIEAQAELPSLVKDKTAKGEKFSYDYVGLDSVLPAVLKVLTSHGLGVVQPVGTADNGGAAVTTMLVHKSGEWLRDTQPLIVVKNDPQGQGSAITYARRYGLMAMLGLVADDDDGGAASGRKRSSSANTTPATNGTKPATAEAIPLDDEAKARAAFWANQTKRNLKKQELVYRYLGIENNVEHPLTTYWLLPCEAAGLTRPEAYRLADSVVGDVLKEALKAKKDGDSDPLLTALGVVQPLSYIAQAAKAQPEPATA